MPSIRIVLTDGQSLETRSVTATPLGLVELDHYRSDRGSGLRLELHFEAASLNGRAVEAGQATIHLTPHESLNVFALVEGGWLPPPFANPPAMLVDQNVVINFERVRSGKVSKQLEDLTWWMEFLNDPQTVMNPLPYALEGTSRRAPTYDEVVMALRHGAEEIRAALPSVTITRFAENQYRAIHELVRDASARSIRDAEFLLDVAPLIARPIALGGELDVERRVLARALHHKLPARAFAVIASLSCLYRGSHGRSIGMQLIRPRAKFSLESAYAAASDIRHLEMLVRASIPDHGPRFALCTQDIGLASFWSALRPMLTRNSSSTFSLTFELPTELFPRLAGDGLEALHGRLEAASREDRLGRELDVW